jgi:hypothetical protein
MPEKAPSAGESQENEMMQVGENLIRPGSSGQYEHIDLPIGEEKKINREAYQTMVERPGFPPAPESDGKNSLFSTGVDIEV